MTGRRTHRSARFTVALVLLLAAAALIVAALVAGSLLAVSAAAVVALAAGGTSYVLARSEVLAVRRACASERRDLAQSYRALFERRSEEAAVAQRRLRESLTQAQQRATRAEARLADPVQDLVAWEQWASEAAAPRQAAVHRSA